MSFWIEIRCGADVKATSPDCWSSRNEGPMGSAYTRDRVSRRISELEKEAKQLGWGKSKTGDGRLLCPACSKIEPEPDNSLTDPSTMGIPE